MKSKKNELIDSQVVKISRQLISKSTRFTPELQKLFYITLAYANRNFDLPLKPKNAIAIPKNEVFKLLNVTDTNRHYRYKQLFKKMQQSSWFEFGDSENFESGYVFYHLTGNRHYWYLMVNDMFIPAIKNVASNYVQLLLDDVIAFQSKHTMMLYQSLLSLNNTEEDENKIIRCADYTTKQMKELFNLGIDDYTRRDGSFVRNTFEKRCIETAVNEINSKSKVIHHLIWYKEYDGRFVSRYVFKYQVNDIDGLKTGISGQEQSDAAVEQIFKQ